MQDRIALLLHFYWYTNFWMAQSLDYNSRLPDITCVLGHHSAAQSEDLGNWKM